MTLSRRDFMKVFGASVASMLLTQCRLPLPVSCYAPLPPPTDTVTSRGRLRSLWLRFNELAQAARATDGESETLAEGFKTEHRNVLNIMISNGDLTAPVADLVQEAYEAAVYHVWRSNINVTCYEPVWVDYGPTSASILVEQAESLALVSEQNSIDPDTLAKAQAALEHDMAFYALSDTDLQALYDRLTEQAQVDYASVPEFAELELEVTPDAKAAAQFIIDLLTEK